MVTETTQNQSWSQHQFLYLNLFWFVKLIFELESIVGEMTGLSFRML